MTERTARALPAGDAGKASAPSSVDELTRRNVERIQALETAEHSKATTADHLADAVTRFSGSIKFVWISVLLVGGWVGWNLLAEQENTKLLLMLEQIGKAVGADVPGDPDVAVLVQATEPEALAKQIDRAVEEGSPRTAG